MIKYKRSICVHNTYKSSVLKTESVFITVFVRDIHNRVFIIQCSYKSQSNGGNGGKLQCRSHAALKSVQALLWLIAML